MLDERTKKADERSAWRRFLHELAHRLRINDGTVVIRYVVVGNAERMQVGWSCATCGRVDWRPIEDER